jgi:hypothetical protein
MSAGSAIWSLGFSPNGEILAGGRQDNSLPQEKASRTVRLWTRVLSEPEPPFLWLTVLFNDSLDLPVGQVNGPCVHLGSRRCYLYALIAGVMSAQTMQFFAPYSQPIVAMRYSTPGTEELVLHKTQPA